MENMYVHFSPPFDGPMPCMCRLLKIWFSFFTPLSILLLHRAGTRILYMYRYHVLDDVCTFVSPPFSPLVYPLCTNFTSPPLVVVHCIVLFLIPFFPGWS